MTNKIKYAILRLSKPAIFLLVFFVSFFLLTEAEENNEFTINFTPTFPIEYDKDINDGLLTMLTDSSIFVMNGGSSFYGSKFHNRKTSSGQRYDMNKFTAAHRTLPFGTIVRVTNTNTNKSSLVIINDRGPFIRKRIIDISNKAAKAIGNPGIPPVRISGISNSNYPDSNFYSNKFIVFPLIKDVSLAEWYDINFMKQMSDFSEAVELIHTLQALNPNVPYCLVVSANEYFIKTFDRTYYIGILLRATPADSYVSN
jgi:rare lipoprotein A